MFKLGTSICLGFLCLLSQALCDERPVVKIGMVAALSGSMSFYGKGWSSAAQLAVSELQGTRYRYELLVEDDKSSAASAVSAFHKLARIDHAEILLSASANMALALAPLARNAQKIHLGISSDASFADGKFNFNYWPAPLIPASSLIEQFKKRSLTKVALIGLEHGWPRAVYAELAKAAPAAGVAIVMQEYFAPGERNFRSLLSRLGKSGAQMAVLLSWPPELDIFARQYRELQVKVPLTADWAFEASAEPALFNGFWFVSIPPADPAYSIKFKERFGYAPYAQMELGDLMINSIVTACEAAGDGRTLPRQARVAEELLNIKALPGVFGPVSFDKSGVLEIPYVLKIVEHGQIRTSAD